MNQPEYVLVDEFKPIVEAVRVRCGLAALNYEYGYVKELNVKLQEALKANAEKASTVFPLIWVMQPFTVTRGIQGYYGRTLLRVLIIKDTEIAWRSEERMAKNFKPILHPIRRALYTELSNTQAFAFTDEQNRKVDEQDLYYWGEEQAAVLDNPVDVVNLTNLEIFINNNLNCIPQGGILGR